MIRGGNSKRRWRIVLLALCLGGVLGAMVGAGPALTAAVATTLGTDSSPTSSNAALAASSAPTSNTSSTPTSSTPTSSIPTSSIPTPPVTAPTFTVKKTHKALPGVPLTVHTVPKTTPAPNPNDPDADGDVETGAPPPQVVTSTPQTIPQTTPVQTPLPIVHTAVVHRVHRVVHRVHRHHAIVRHVRHVRHHSVVRAHAVKGVQIHRTAPSLPNAVHVTTSAATPSALRLDAKKLALAAALGGFLILLLAFPSEIFNKTYQENEEEIHLLVKRAGFSRYHLPGILGFIVFTLIGAGLSLWVALDEGAKGNIAAAAIGLFVALPLVTFAFELPREAYSRFRSRIPGSLHVLPTALIVGLVCASVSRLLHLHPAYLYGVFAGFVAARADALREEHEAHSVLLAVLLLTGVVLAAWFGWGALDAQAHGLHRGWLVIIGSTVLFWIFMLGAEALVFGLMPLRYLDGSVLKRWRTTAWLIPQLLAAAFFVYVQMLHGASEKIDSINELVRPFAMFVIFGLLSFAFWGYFHWQGRPTRIHEPGPTLEPPELLPAADQPLWTGPRELGEGTITTAPESDHPPA